VLALALAGSTLYVGTSGAAVARVNLTVRRAWRR